MSEIADLLDTAADVIVERGWFRGGYKDPAGQGVCLVGAVSIAAGLAPDAMGIPGGAPDHVHVAITAVERRVTDGDLDITDWNDEVAEDSAEVITALREAAAAERGRES